jgi:hypothetical protein
VSCKDEETLSCIHRDKHNAIINSVSAEIKNFLKYATKVTGQDLNNYDLEGKLELIKNTLNRNFISEYEIAAQNIVDHSMQSAQLDFANKRKLLLIDLLVAGMVYYKVKPSNSNTQPELIILNPINTFIDRNLQSPYFKDSQRAVIRYFMTKQQILSTYGKYITKEHLEQLETAEEYAYDDYGVSYIRSFDQTSGVITDGILGGLEVTPYNTMDNASLKYMKTIPVYEVEELETRKENGKFVTHRKQAIRIGTSIFIELEEDENVVRSMGDPDNCTLSVNGMFFSDRNGDPFSLVLSTSNLQDKYDCLHFYRDNVIAESGTVGDWLDVAHLPKFLGATVAERLMKWKAYKKTGLALYDSSQEGQVVNTAFNGYNDAIKLETVQAIDLAIQRIEETCSNITGVFRERIGGIEQRDAVTNVQVGVRNSAFITKQYYQVMDLMTRDMLVDILNISKIVYKNGITGTLVLGDKLNKIFTALPEHFTLTDHDIHISDSSEIIKEEETLKNLMTELTKAGIADAEIIIEVITSKSMTSMKNRVLEALDRRKQESNQVGQLSQQLEQLDSQLKESTQTIKQLQSKIERLNEEKLKLEYEKLNHAKQLDWFEAKSEDSYRKEQIEWEKKRVQLEGVQLLDNNKNNDEIKNE